MSDTDNEALSLAENKQNTPKNETKTNMDTENNPNTTGNTETGKNASKLNPNKEDSFSSTKESFSEEPKITYDQAPSPEIRYSNDMPMINKNKNNSNKSSNAHNVPNHSPDYKPQPSASVDSHATHPTQDVARNDAISHAHSGSIVNDKNNPLLTTKLQPNQVMDIQMDDDQPPPDIGRMPRYVNIILIIRLL